MIKILLINETQRHGNEILENNMSGQIPTISENLDKNILKR